MEFGHLLSMTHDVRPVEIQFVFEVCGIRLSVGVVIFDSPMIAF